MNINVRLFGDLKDLTPKLDKSGTIGIMELEEKLNTIEELLDHLDLGLEQTQSPAPQRRLFRTGEIDRGRRHDLHISQRHDIALQVVFPQEGRLIPHESPSTRKNRFPRSQLFKSSPR